MASKNKTYTVNVKLVDFWISKDIKADSLENALAQSRELKPDDFVDIKGDWIDGHLAVIGVMEQD